MIYFSILLVILGVICFVYAIFVLPKRKREGRYHPQKTYRKKLNIEEALQRQKQDISAKYPLFNMKYPETKSSADLEERILMERRLTRNPNQNLAEEDTIIKKPSIQSSEPEAKGNATSQVSDILVTEEHEEVIAPKPQQPPPIPEELLVTKGTLFLDYGRKIPFQSRKLKETDWKEDDFSSFKRIGDIKMTDSNGFFEFHHSNTIYKYRVEELEQVIFYEHAFSLIPDNPVTPTPLVFTDDIENFKKFLSKTYS